MEGWNWSDYAKNREADPVRDNGNTSEKRYSERITGRDRVSGRVRRRTGRWQGGHGGWHAHYPQRIRQNLQGIPESLLRGQRSREPEGGAGRYAKAHDPGEADRP